MDVIDRAGLAGYFLVVWELGRLDYHEGTLAWAWQEPAIAWPPYSAAERLQAEYAVLGMGVEGHLLALYRPWLEQLGVVTSGALAACRTGARVRVRVAGEVVVRQAPPTAKGYAFVTLEDEEGLINLVLPPPIVAEYRPLLAAEGVVQRQGHALSVQVGRVLPAE